MTEIAMGGPSDHLGSTLPTQNTRFTRGVTGLEPIERIRFVDAMPEDHRFGRHLVLRRTDSSRPTQEDCISALTAIDRDVCAIRNPDLVHPVAANGEQIFIIDLYQKKTLVA